MALGEGSFLTIAASRIEVAAPLSSRNSSTFELLAAETAGIAVRLRPLGDLEEEEATTASFQRQWRRGGVKNRGGPPARPYGSPSQ